MAAVSRLATLLLVGGTAFAQIYPPVGYPGGGYPGRYPGGYPPGYPGGYPAGGGIPLPGRSKPGKGSGTEGQPLPNFRGRLKMMDNKTITLTLGDDRTMDFKRTDKTKFFKDGDEVKDPKFNVGDQISVEGPEDDHGRMVALNVYWEKAAAAASAAAKQQEDKDNGVYDTWKDVPGKSPAPPSNSAPKDAPAAPPAAPPSASQAAPPSGSAAPQQPQLADLNAPLPPPSKAADPDDPGPPKLERGKPANNSREHAPDLADEAPPPVIARADTAAGTAPAAPSTAGIPRFDDGSERESIPRTSGDDLIRKATDAALDFTETLPNYVCQEMMARYQSETAPAQWQALDVVSADVVYENHQESYRNLAINGRKINKKMNELDGAWSTGEFGTVLIDLFSPATAADFHFARESRTAGITARVYDFNVQHANSHWDISMGSQSYTPAYRGSVWIDPANARVLRIEMQAYGFPQEFPTDHVESATDYEYTRLGDMKQYLLPVHSESLSCQRGSNYCSRNVIDFRNYHKYEGESSITYGGDVKK